MEKEQIQNNLIPVTEDIVFYAFRYCLGRQTYCVSDCVKNLKSIWNKLSEQTRKLICKEINIFLDDDVLSSIDAPYWISILEIESKYNSKNNKGNS